MRRRLPRERIEACAETGRRMLSTELVRCAMTSRRVSPELAEACPISGRRLLRHRNGPVRSCRQHVSPQVVERGQCLACRRLKAVTKADPRMARLLHEHPALDRWRRWRMSETSRVYVLVAIGWLKRLLVVVDKETLEFRHLATGSRFSPRWAEVEPGQYAYVLREKASGFAPSTPTGIGFPARFTSSPADFHRHQADRAPPPARGSTIGQERPCSARAGRSWDDLVDLDPRQNLLVRKNLHVSRVEMPLTYCLSSSGDEVRGTAGEVGGRE